MTEWQGVIDLNQIEASARAKLTENTYSWIDPNYVLRLVACARRADYYKAQHDSLYESWAALRATTEGGAE